MKRIGRSILVVLLTMLLLLGLQPPGVEKRVTSGEYVVPAGETLHGGLFISSPGVVTIEHGARVDGAIFMGSGVLNVNGEVGGGIFSLSGDVHLDPAAVVQGHVTVTSVPFDAPAGARVKNHLAADISGWMGGPIGAALLLLVLAGDLFAWPAIKTLLLGRDEAGTRARRGLMARTPLVLTAGVVVLTAGVLGGAWLAGVERATVYWTLAVLVPALAFVALLIARRDRFPSLAVPAAVLAVTGLILIVQTATGYWQSWAYLWALVLPTSIGLGRLMVGWQARDMHAHEAGIRLSGLGLALVAASVALIVASEAGMAVWWLFPVLLVGAGSAWLIGQITRPRRHAEGT